MAFFRPGYTYANRDFITYGPDRKQRQVLNKQAPGTQEIDWVCHSVTKTFATFLDETKTYQRRKIYRDDNGNYVFPKGRYDGAPVLRAEYAYDNGTLSADQDNAQDNDNYVGPDLP